MFALQSVPKIDREELRDLADGNPFFKAFTSWESFMAFMPVLITAIVVLVFFFLLARFLESRLIKILRKRSGNEQVLVANFFGKVLWVIVFGIGVSMTMYILGLGEISSTILGAAGLTTFVVGFALKDIFENFLAGVIIAFDPPFILGSWIEVDGIQGIVTEMSLRQTMLKTFDGQDVYIPNSTVLKNPLRNYTIDGYLRKDFIIGLDYGDDVSQGLQLIEETMKGVKGVLNIPGRVPSAIIDEFATSSINVKCLFWVDTKDNSISTSEITNNVMLSILNVLVDKGHYLPADILEIKYYDPKAEATNENINQLQNELTRLKKKED